MAQQSSEVLFAQNMARLHAFIRNKAKTKEQEADLLRPVQQLLKDNQILSMQVLELRESMNQGENK